MVRLRTVTRFRSDVALSDNLWRFGKGKSALVDKIQYIEARHADVRPPLLRVTLITIASHAAADMIATVI